LDQPTPSLLDAPAVVVGAGVTGLATAHLLSEAGVPVVVVEKLPVVGGLARSFLHDGYVFDVGPHRFHTGNPQVSAWLERMLGSDALYFPRLSEVYFRGKYYRWPLHPRQLVNLPPDVAFRSGLDLLTNSLKAHSVDTFESYVLRQYGPTLYTHFFKDYSEKFLGIHPRDTHPDWATAGINRAIIDDKLQMQNLTQLLKSTFLNFNKAEIDFLYPRPGMYAIWRHVAAEIEANGGRIITGVPARLVADGHRILGVQAGDERITASTVIWTAPITEALEQLHLPEARLPFRTLLLYLVMARHEVPRHYQWCYYGEPAIVFDRISMPRFFSAETSPPGCTGLCVEVTCQQGDERWHYAERLADWVVDDLVRVGMLPDRSVVEDVRLERVPCGYPVYHAHYPEELKRAQASLSAFSNLHMAGRCGTFWYNNMDHCIEAAMDLVKRLLQADHKVEAH
jgi:protoporphyrinogen oxidase